MTAARLDGLNTADQLAAAARSSLYRLLAEAFAFPSAALAERVASGGFLSEIGDALPALPFPLPLPDETRSALADAGLIYEGLQQEYIRLFEVGPGGPPCPPYEGSHRSGRMAIMEELVRFFEHFGLQPLPGDQPDHVCAELEFMHYLSFKEAASLRNGGTGVPYRLAQRDFLQRHLTRWLPALRAGLERLDALRLYREVARLAEEFCVRDLAAIKADSALRQAGAPRPSEAR